MASRGWENVTADQVRKQQSGLSPGSPLASGAGQTGKTITTTGWSAPKKSKYRNVKVSIDGERFDSKAEADFWIGLKARERDRDLKNLRRQVRHALHAPIAGCPGATVQIAEYVSDFEWDEKTHIDAIHYRHIVCDVKGHKTAGYLLKKRWLFLEYGIEIQEV